MYSEAALTIWILKDNLNLFLKRASELVDYCFADWDWDAIRFGVRDTDFQQNRWYTYELYGSSPVKFAFAEGENSEHLQMVVKTEKHQSASIGAFAIIMQSYEEASGPQSLIKLVETVFIETLLPDQSKIVSCDAAHLACCLECQEVVAFFGGKHWMALIQENISLPNGYAGPGFLVPEAQRFFFPAYLVAAMRQKDQGLLDIYCRLLEQEVWTPLQQELIEFAQRLLQIK